LVVGKPVSLKLASAIRQVLATWSDGVRDYSSIDGVLCESRQWFGIAGLAQVYAPRAAESVPERL